MRQPPLTLTTEVLRSDRFMGIANALEFFKKSWFSRRDCLEHQQAQSTATASREPRWAVEQGLLERHGDRATTRYRGT